jgi:hypothetical protein
LPIVEIDNMALKISIYFYYQLIMRV